MTTTFIVLLAVAGALCLLYLGKVWLAWVLPVAGALLWTANNSFVWWLMVAIASALAALFGFAPIRRAIVSQPLMKVMRRALPKIGETERIALDAGDVWFDGELFSGKPDWRKLIEFKIPRLSAEEQAFLDGPVEALCAMLDDYAIAQQRDLPKEVWQFLGEQGFFGLIIPKRYGGKEFSARAHSAIVTKIASRSIPAAVTAMVPNSLGPAELLLHYGTEAQREQYLPRLAKGEELPCFALTGPEAGSDAAATQSRGVICKGRYGGKDVLGMKLYWRKRYITLAPVATVVGLAFRLYDPDGLLGDQEDLGITCALIPRKTKGVKIGQRHDPMGVPFQNGPTVGEAVFVPLDFIIGGVEMAGQGWRMLMESLAVGRSISLPALSVGAAQLTARVVGAYGTVREQFDTPIGRFEGVEEPMARIGAHAYFMTAARNLTCGALDQGFKPSVVSAIVKAYLTEGMRDCVDDAMDVRAGAAIMRGPRNVLGRCYSAVPIGITVEGSNILTRTMIIYGQGAIRCHPFVEEEIESVAEDDLERFDRAFFGHGAFVVRNWARSLLLALTGSRLASGHVDAQVAGYFRHLSRMSAAFSLTSDVAMGTLGGALKRREKISGRLADCLGWMYLASAALKRYADDSPQPGDQALVKWSCEHALYQVQTALLGIFDNLPNRLAGRLLKWSIFPIGAHFRPPSDQLGSNVARGLLEDRDERCRLTADIYVPDAEEDGLGRLEYALDRAVDALAVETKLRDAVRAGQLDRAPGPALAEAGLAANVISADEMQVLNNADEARDEVIRVDAFTPAQYKKLKG